MNDSLKSTFSDTFAMVGMTSFWRQARASGHLDLSRHQYRAAHTMQMSLHYVYIQRHPRLDVYILMFATP